MSEDENKKGFSELSSLASDVELTLEELTSRQARPEQPTADHASQESHSSPQEQELEPYPVHSLNTEQEIVVSGVSREPDLGSSGVKWYLIFVVAVVLIWLFNFDGEEEVVPDSVTSISAPLASSSPSPTPESQLRDLEFLEPSVGDNHILSVGQIRWCLREDIWIEVLLPMATTNSQIDQFNSATENYNRRCASFRYREGTLKQAQQQVESFRAQLVSRVPLPWDPAALPANSDSIQTGAQDLLPRPDRNSLLTLEVQSALSLLGYDIGPVDGILGDRTRLAIQNFQRDVGVAIDGRMTVSLLEQLQDEAASRPTQAAITSNDTESTTQITAPADMPASRFTRGSHESELIQVQGTPTRITRYDVLGHETWYFDRSTVDIDSQTRQVLEWDNDGNLNVQYSPGDQITATRTFTRNSHSDDVLRLQGTPTKITRYDALGHETWYFGRSTVDIDSQSYRVLEWDNDGNLNVQYSPGDQITATRTFTRNSHSDDVLRLQGTPTKITRYDALGYETWYFGRSSVTIDIQTLRVLEWNNQGNLQVGL